MYCRVTKGKGRVFKHFLVNARLYSGLKGDGDGYQLKKYTSSVGKVDSELEASYIN
ncbi:hypothetical protein HanRHA438_Chr01g0030231 [Helianthus annuus]|nr:hypothetical protein HanRHA438_Chr01g0030231 [Helianthus annuus]